MYDSASSGHDLAVLTYRQSGIGTLPMGKDAPIVGPVLIMAHAHTRVRTLPPSGHPQYVLWSKGPPTSQNYSRQQER